MKYDVYADGVCVATCSAMTEGEALEKGCRYAQMVHPHRTMVVAVMPENGGTGIVRRVFPSVPAIKREAL